MWYFLFSFNANEVLIVSVLYDCVALVHPENQLCAFLNYSGVDAWRVIEIQGTSVGHTINPNDL